MSLADGDYAGRLAHFIVDHVDQQYDAEEAGQVLEFRAQGPFDGFDPELRLLFVLPAYQRPEHTTAMNLNAQGGVMVNPDGRVWWIPRRTKEQR